MNKNIYIAWSGGIDSTYLIWKNLCNGNNVQAGYINLENNSNKVENEIRSIKKLNKIFKKYNFKYLGEVSKIVLNKVPPSINLSQPIIWLSSLVISLPENIDEIQIGYILNDCAISYINEIKKAYKYLMKFTSQLNKPPKLVFPLMKTSKQDIIQEIPTKILNKTWFCENPFKKNTACGECAICKKFKHIYYDCFSLNHGSSKYFKKLKKELRE